MNVDLKFAYYKYDQQALTLQSLVWKNIHNQVIHEEYIHEEIVIDKRLRYFLAWRRENSFCLARIHTSSRVTVLHMDTCAFERRKEAAEKWFIDILPCPGIIFAFEAHRHSDGSGWRRIRNIQKYRCCPIYFFQKCRYLLQRGIALLDNASTNVSYFDTFLTRRHILRCNIINFWYCDKISCIFSDLEFDCLPSIHYIIHCILRLHSRWKTFIFLFYS